MKNCLIFTLLVLSIIAIADSRTFTGVKITKYLKKNKFSDFRFRSTSQRNKVTGDTKWPVTISEIYAGDLSQKDDSHPCRQMEVCRTWNNVRDEALAYLKNQQVAENNDIYYVFTQQKNLAKKKYGQFLFSELPQDAADVPENYTPKLISVCVPLEKKEEIFTMDLCPLDFCQKSKTDCKIPVNQDKILAKFHSKDYKGNTVEDLNKMAEEKWPEDSKNVKSVQTSDKLEEPAPTSTEKTSEISSETTSPVETPVETPVEKTPVENTPVEETTPVENNETPVENNETPVENTPVENNETPVENTDARFHHKKSEPELFDPNAPTSQRFRLKEKSSKSGKHTINKGHRVAKKF